MMTKSKSKTTTAPKKRKTAKSRLEDDSRYVTLAPDWTTVYTPTEAEQDLPGFRFRGVGWYYTKDDTILVLASSASDDRYRFLTWTRARLGSVRDGSPAAMFNWLVNLPTRKDSR